MHPDSSMVTVKGRFDTVTSFLGGDLNLHRNQGPFYLVLSKHLMVFTVVRFSHFRRRAYYIFLYGK